jgi:hypothetical protein
LGEGADSKVQHAEPDRTAEERKAARAERKARRQNSWKWRMSRIVFHMLWLPLLLAGALAGGLLIGYSVIGGEPPGEVFSLELWQHLYDMIYAEG